MDERETRINRLVAECADQGVRHGLDLWPRVRAQVGATPWVRRRPVLHRVVIAVAGTVLAFCRALGDFGITLMVAGSIPGLTQTTPLAIYDLVQSNRMAEANTLSLIAVATVALLLMGIGRLARLRF